MAALGGQRVAAKNAPSVPGVPLCLADRCQTPQSRGDAQNHEPSDPGLSRTSVLRLLNESVHVSNLKSSTLAALILASSTVSAANLVTNGSFESPNVVGGANYVLYTTGSTGITGWTVLGPAPSASVQLTPDTFAGLKASDGRQWIDLTGITGYDKGLRSDVITTTLGTTYYLSFDVGNYLPFGVSTLGVSINGGPEQLFVNTSLAVTATNPMNWAGFGFSWVATSASAQLTFIGRANGALSNFSGIGLDNVVFAPVPEPGRLGLLVLGLAAIALRLARRC